MSLSFRVSGLALLAAACGFLGVAQAAPAAATGGAAATSSSAAVQVSLPIAEYEKLVGRPSVTVVDTLRLSGSFSGRDLALVLSGRAAGLGPKIEVLAAPPAVSIYGCEGEAVLAKNASGVFELVPQANRFTLRCRVATSGSDRLQLETTASVLWIESNISDGELASSAATDSEQGEKSGSDKGGEVASGRRSITVVRVSGGTTEVTSPSAVGHYRITLQPEATLFTYQLDVMNPNRAQQPLVVSLKSGEHVQKVDAAISFEPNGNEYRFQLPPGEQRLTISGTLPRPTFAPPVSASVHYLLIESHPLLRPNVTAAAQRISAQETGLKTPYRGARGFLLTDADKVSWQVVRLEALRTTSFAVNRAQHTFFLAGDGQALGESVLNLDNQGAPAISLPMHAEPSYASLGHESVLLTRDDSGDLWLPLAHGPQEVLVQHHQSVRRLGGFAAGALWLPEVAVPSSSAAVELRYAHEWLPLYEEFSPELRLPVLDAGLIVGWLLLFLWCERLLALLGVGRGYRIVTAIVLAKAALTASWWLTILCVGNLTLTGVLIWPWLNRRKWNLWTVVGALVLGGFVFLIGASMLLSRGSMGPGMSKQASVADRRSYLSEEPTVEKPKPADDKGGGAAYQGLPAKFVMPIGSEQSVFQREMMSSSSSSAGGARAAYVVMVSRTVVSLVGSALFALGLLLLLGRRRQLRRGFLDLWHRLQRPAAGNATG